MHSYTGPPRSTCCSPAVEVLPKNLAFSQVALGKESTLDLFIIHSGPYQVSWYIDTTTLPTWLSVPASSGILKGGETLMLPITAKHSDLSASLSPESFTLKILAGKEELKDQINENDLYACKTTDSADGILQTKIIDITFDRVVGSLHPTSCSLIKETGGTDLVKSTFFWTFTAKDEG